VVPDGILIPVSTAAAVVPKLIHKSPAEVFWMLMTDRVAAGSSDCEVPPKVMVVLVSTTLPRAFIRNILFSFTIASSR